MAHLVITRRCNLSCGYCFEYSKTAPPVPLVVLKQRIDELKRLRVVFVTLTGGESLLHPDIIELVAYVHDSGMTPVMNSNAYRLTRELTIALGEAGLYALQISIDNIEPNAVTKKSLRPLLPKLRLLAQHAKFRVRVNTVLGTGSPTDAIEVAKVVTELGFDAKCSLVRDEDGGLMPLGAEEKAAYAQIRALDRSSTSYLSEDFQQKLIDDGEVEWKCRSGARYFTVCEDGLVHLCESSYHSPGKPLHLYMEADIRQAFHSQKSCAATCAVAYAHQGSRLDVFRSQHEQQTVRKLSWMGQR